MACPQVRALFAVAAHVAPSVIFIDEVDSLLSARKSDGALPCCLLAALCSARLRPAVGPLRTCSTVFHQRLLAPLLVATWHRAVHSCARRARVDAASED